ncbi:MAG: hypothetical protein Fur002_11930 [Anaerolineales bacterium]
MPDLLSTLRKHDLGHLHIVAGFWGLELESRAADAAAEELSAAMLDAELTHETLDILPAAARPALDALLRAGGKIEWAAFSRQFGDIREMGEARRDRERPYLKPASSAEILFYRSMVEKAFFETEKGLQEFAYIPEDLRQVIQEARAIEPSEPPAQPLGRLATPLEKARESLATDEILDDATTYLAALRVGEDVSQFSPRFPALLAAAGLLRENAPQPEAVKNFLEAPRPQALALLQNAWLASASFNELRLLPAIICEGEWKNQPQVTREFLLDLVAELPSEKWWSLPAFIRDLKVKFPDFQRPAGDYDSWFIKRAADGQYLRGFAYWDEVDGALVKDFFDLLHWLGKADAARSENGEEITAFRLAAPRAEVSPVARIKVAANGKILIPRAFSRAARYQLARFCAWAQEKSGEYIYFINAQSLRRANAQGLKAEQALALLMKYADGGVPPPLAKALKNWDASGVSARVESVSLVRADSPEILDALRKSKAGKFLGEALSPTAALVKRGAESKVAEALLELGVMAEIKIESQGE